MTKRLLDERRHEAEIIVVFSNTGSEHEETLKFVDRCDREFGFDTRWIEAVTPPERGIGARAKLVTFETAARHGEPFEGVIAKHGIPNKVFPLCTKELKERPIKAYARSLGWKSGTYDLAIGIRTDEIDRMNPKATEARVIYPLIQWRINRADVLGWWRRQAFDLYLPEHLGNCTWCWKKTLRKHLTLARQNPEVFEFPERMERLYPYQGPGSTGAPRHFFRDNRTVADLRRLSQANDFQPFRDGNEVFDPDLDVGEGCEESCEVFGDLVDLMKP